VDGAGNLFGTSGGGGSEDDGRIWELAQGGTAITVRYNFTDVGFGTIGVRPDGIAVDSVGNLYGATAAGGSNNYGSVWELPKGSSTAKLLYSFEGAASDGGSPSGIAVDSRGNLFGTSQLGGANGYGTVWELPKGSHTVTVLYSFAEGGDAKSPAIAVDPLGDVYVASSGGGVNGDGAILQFTGFSSTGGGTSLAFAQQPVSTTPSATLGTITVDIDNSNGDILTSDDSDVTLTLAGGSSGAMLDGTTTVAAVNGVATFTGLSVNTIGNDYTLNASDGTDISATSDTFSIAAAGTSILNPAISRSTLPGSVIAGAAAHGVVTVKVTNTGSGTQHGTVTEAIFASQDGAIDGSSVPLGSFTGNLNILTNRSKTVAVNIASVPASLDGTYTLLVKLTDSNGNISESTTGPTLTVAAPFIGFSETVIKTTLHPTDVSGGKTSGLVFFKVTNGGNIASTGLSQVDLFLSSDGTAADGTLIRTVKMPIVLRPGAGRTISLPLLSLPAVSDGSYNVVVQIIDHRGDVTQAASAGQYHLATPFISLVPSLGTEAIARNGSAVVTFTVTNDGNIAPNLASTVSLYASPDGNISDGAMLISRSEKLLLLPGQSRLLHLRLTAAQQSQASAAGMLLIDVVDQNLQSQVLAIPV
jgi:uncharacterized repeat protein (TIGR03803 family)